MDYVVSFGHSHTLLTPAFTLFVRLDTGLPVASPAISELGVGMYKFSYTPSTYDVAFQIDAGDPTITDEQIRYVSGVLGKIDYQIEVLRKFATNKWIMESNQLKLYDDDGIAVLYTFDLYDSLGNPAMALIHKRDPV